MGDRSRRAAYASLWMFALAFGWIEASVVVYLRETYARNAALLPAAFAGLQLTLVSLPGRLVALEIAREACTIVALGAVAWLAGRRPADRAGSFLLAFGIWDLTYYAVLKLALGWPESPSTWDILFLIPLPWVAPVWAPMTVAALFVVAGSYLFWTPARVRRYGRLDLGILATSALLTTAAFLVESRAAIDHRVPEQFPVWLFWAGVMLGLSWFIRVERRVSAAAHERAPWMGVRVRTILPSGVQAEPSDDATVGGGVSDEVEDADLGSVIWEYTEANRTLDGLVSEATEIGGQLERLAEGLTLHPDRLIIGRPRQTLDEAHEWDVVPSHPLPRIEGLARLTDDIREASAKVEQLRERLILKGRADLVQRQDAFYH